MKESELSFMDGFTDGRGQRAKAAGAKLRMFDFEKAAKIIKDRFSKHPDLVAEAGLQRDWAHTGGEIFRDGKPTSEDYTYLASNWATPTLILSWDGEEQEELECSKEGSDSDAKWDEKSLKILGVTQ